MLIEKCDICGKLAAVLHVCRLCKHRVCEEHFKPQEGICSQCHSRLSLATQTPEDWMSAIFIKLFLLGFVLVVAGIIILIVAAVLQGSVEVSGAAIIFIGPIPIIIGAGPHTSLILLLAAILTIVGFVMFFWLRKTVPKP